MHSQTSSLAIEQSHSVRRPRTEHKNSLVARIRHLLPKTIVNRCQFFLRKETNSSNECLLRKNLLELDLLNLTLVSKTTPSPLPTIQTTSWLLLIEVIQLTPEYDFCFSYLTSYFLLATDTTRPRRGYLSLLYEYMFTLPLISLFRVLLKGSFAAFLFVDLYSLL